jgi:hypothetical protein
MTHQEAAAVVGSSLADVETQLRDVTCWPKFLVGLEEVTQLSHERYRFTVRNGSKRSTADMAVVFRPREHRISWKALNGPPWRGDLRLAAIGERRTKVSLSTTLVPHGFGANVAEMFGRHSTDAVMDLQRLQDLLWTSSPRP